MLDPHSPYDPVPKFADRIKVDESKLPVPRSYYSKRKYDPAQRSAIEQIFIRNLYLAEVESVDERVGFIIEMLKHNQLLDSTYIIFTSDHGEQFGEHGLFGHGGHGKGCHYYEGLMRVPLIISGPHIPKGKRIKDLISLLDLPPTLKELLGVKYQEKMQGESLGPIIFENARRDGHLFFDDIQDHDQVDALIEGGYKLITLKNDKYELYDIDIDPRELTSFAYRVPERIDLMMDRILKMRKENKQLQKKNIQSLGGNLDKMSAEEKQKVIEKLKALGYIN
jgi:arylsulfatase A-like enzyme